MITPPRSKYSYLRMTGCVRQHSVVDFILCGPSTAEITVYKSADCVRSRKVLIAGLKIETTCLPPTISDQRLDMYIHTRKYGKKLRSSRRVGQGRGGVSGAGVHPAAEPRRTFFLFFALHIFVSFFSSLLVSSPLFPFFLLFSIPSLSSFSGVPPRFASLTTSASSPLQPDYM